MQGMQAYFCGTSMATSPRTRSAGNPDAAGLQAARGYPSRARPMHVRTHHSLTTSLVITHGYLDCAATFCW